MIAPMLAYTLEADMPTGIVISGRECITTSRVTMLVGPDFVPRYDDWVMLLKLQAITPDSNEQASKLRMVEFIEKAKARYDDHAEGLRKTLARSGNFPANDKAFLDVGRGEGETLFSVTSWNPNAREQSYHLRVRHERLPVMDRSAFVLALSLMPHHHRLKVFGSFCCVCGVNCPPGSEGNYCPQHKDEPKKFVMTQDQLLQIKRALTMQDAPEAPCVGCRHVCRPSCHCVCHRYRLQWLDKARELAIQILTPKP